jgi:hypothetical protein
MFYVVGARKLAILFLVTGGLYFVYWTYKNWDCYKDRMPAGSAFGTTVWPVQRALFSVFFVHALLRKVRAHGIEHDAIRRWASSLNAWWLVLLLLLGECIDTIADATLGAPYGDLASLAALALMLPALAKAQRMINLVCGDPDGAANARLTRANIAWIVIGAIGWAVTIVQAFMAK